MNVAYSEELSPPKELFSREWFDASNHLDLLRFRTARIDETKKKLEDLETKLRQKIWKRGGGYKQDHLVDTITLLNSHIGVWNVYTDDNIRYIQTRAQLERLEIKMIHPDNTRVMSKWEWLVLGKVQRTGVCVAMLSPQCVEWLNTVSDWVGDMRTVRI